MFLRATCKRNKLNLLNSTWKIVKVECWSSLCWSLIHPWINRGNCLFMQKWKLTVYPLCVDCWSPPRSTDVITSVLIASASITSASITSVSIVSTLIINRLYIDHWSCCLPRINRGDCLSMWKWKLTVYPLCVDHQSPKSTEVIAFSHESERLTVDPFPAYHWSPSPSTIRSWTWGALKLVCSHSRIHHSVLHFLSRKFLRIQIHHE